MFTHILIPTDGSELSAVATESALSLAKTHKAKVTIMMASPTFRQMADEGFILPGLQMGKRDWEEAATNRARKVLDDVAGQAASAGVKCDTVHVFKDMPHTAIIDTAKKQGCDLIVMGSHGYGGFKQWVLGNETTRVLSQSKIPVLVYR